MGVTEGIRLLLCSPNPQCQVTSSMPLRALHVFSQSEIHAMAAVLAGRDIYMVVPDQARGSSLRDIRIELESTDPATELREQVEIPWEAELDTMQVCACVRQIL